MGLESRFMSLPSYLRPSHAKLPPTLDAFRNPGFRLLWPANYFSYVSRWMQMALLMWLVLDLTDSSPSRVALVGFFGMIPLLVFGALGGVIADRADRRKVLLMSQLLNLVASLVMSALLLFDLAQFWHAYPIMLVSGLGWALDMPSRRAIVRDSVGYSGVTNAMALDSVGMHSSRMTGPILAGGLTALVGVEGAYFSVPALYLVAIAFLTIMKSPPRGAPAPQAASIVKNLLEGFAYLRASRIILATVIITVLMNLLLFPYMQMVPVIARETLGVVPGLRMGMMMGADGLGAIVGSMAIASFGQLKYHGRVYVAGSLIGLCMVLLFAASQWFWVSLLVLTLLGLGTAGFGTMQSTIVVISASDEMRGRALGVISIAIGAGPIGALLIGVLAELLSPAAAIAVFAVLGIVSLLTVSALMPEIRARMGQSVERSAPGSGASGS